MNNNNYNDNDNRRNDNDNRRNDNDNYRNDNDNRRNRGYKNIAELQINVCGENVTICSNEVDVDKISIIVEKTANKRCVFTGNELEYTIKICNDSAIDIDNAIFSDFLPKGLLLEPETFKYNYVHYDPTYTPFDNKVSYCINKLCAYSDSVVTFCTKVL